MGIDIVAILIQLSGALVWPIMDYVGDGPRTMQFPWAIPLGLFLTSFGWWECFLDRKADVPFIEGMWNIHNRMVETTRYFTYLLIPLLKITVFLFVMWACVVFNGIIVVIT